jgi:acyl dehydratase
VRTFSSSDEIVAAKGQQLGTSEWHEITQDRVNLFADATGDHQWIHVDPEKAATGPFGATIAHGFLSLSLLPLFGPEIYATQGVTMGINYGLDKVRFVTPVRVGARVRDTAELIDAVATDKGTRLIIRHTVEIENEPKPALVADMITLLFW